jgi:hypothetical protein
MLPFLPAKPCLQSLITNVFDSTDYEALKEISQTCRNTLHTLILTNEHISVDLDDINIGSNLLKTVGINDYNGHGFDITNFGDNLEHFEYQGFSVYGYRSMIQAMKKTSKLKTLSLVVSDEILEDALEDIPLILENNKNTLRTFYIRDWQSRGNDIAILIPHLLASKVKLCSVTTLFFDFVSFDHVNVRSLAEIFPNVELLGLTSTSLHVDPSDWLTTDDLSHFQHLKAIDEITYSTVIDKDEVTYQKCIIPYNKFWVPPSKNTTFF